MDLKKRLHQLILTSNDNIELEENLLRMLNEFCCEVVAEVLEDHDTYLMQDMQQKGYKCERKDTRNIQFLFGNVCFKRRLWKKNKESVYPLDETLGFMKYVRYSPLVMMKASLLATQNTYQNSAEAIQTLTTLSISDTGVRNIVLRSAEIVEEYMIYQEDYEVPEKKEVPVLYIEGDGLMLSSQKQTKMTLHRFQLHEGTRKSGSRSECINRIQFADFSYQIAYNRFFNYLHRHYDLKNTVVITNSDGGSGYSPEVFAELALGCKQHEHFIDAYHVNRKLIERMFYCMELIQPMKKAIRMHSEEALIPVFDTMESLVSDGAADEMEHLRLLKGYVSRNWQFMRPFYLRQLSASRSGIGVCESNHRPFSYRMKRQGRSWGKIGGNAIAHLIDARKNDSLREALSNAWKRQVTIVQALVDTRLVQKLLGYEFQMHTGAVEGKISNYGSSASSLGRIRKALS